MFVLMFIKGGQTRTDDDDDGDNGDDEGDNGDDEGDNDEGDHKDDKGNQPVSKPISKKKID